MNRDEAFKALLDGNKVTHKYFSRSEYLHMVDGVITGEDGVNLHSYFFNTDFMSDGFRIYKGDEHEQIS